MGMWCRKTMRKLVKDLDAVPDTETFKASCTWFNKFKRRWGFTFKQKTNVKKKICGNKAAICKKVPSVLAI